jgi:hypothetical protein
MQYGRIEALRSDRPLLSYPTLRRPVAETGLYPCSRLGPDDGAAGRLHFGNEQECKLDSFRSLFAYTAKRLKTGVRMTGGDSTEAAQ